MSDETRTENSDSSMRACPVCGQSFDTNDLDHVFHHGPDAHQPREA